MPPIHVFPPLGRVCVGYVDANYPHIKIMQKKMQKILPWNGRAAGRFHSEYVTYSCWRFPNALRGHRRSLRFPLDTGGHLMFLGRLLQNFILARCFFLRTCDRSLRTIMALGCWHYENSTLPLAVTSGSPQLILVSSFRGPFSYLPRKILPWNGRTLTKEERTLSQWQLDITA